MAIFEAEELADLGVSQADLCFTADMTIQEFHEAEAHFRRALPLREISWWSSKATRLRAEFTMETRFSEQSQEACSDLIAWLRLSNPSSRDKYVDLDWLFHSKQQDFEAWASTNPRHQQVLDNLAIWLDESRCEAADVLLDANAIQTAIQASLSMQDASVDASAAKPSDAASDGAN